uniref:Uncharacterized protein n=1 Tax=Cannabis sativa TaxID=3483 RepID=A0A803PT70_CANSA
MAYIVLLLELPKSRLEMMRSLYLAACRIWRRRKGLSAGTRPVRVQLMMFHSRLGLEAKLLRDLLALCLHLKAERSSWGTFRLAHKTSEGQGGQDFSWWKFGRSSLPPPLLQPAPAGQPVIQPVGQGTPRPDRRGESFARKRVAEAVNRRIERALPFMDEDQLAVHEACCMWLAGLGCCCEGLAGHSILKGRMGDHCYDFDTDVVFFFYFQALMKLSLAHDGSLGSSDALWDQVKTLEASFVVKDKAISKLEALLAERQRMVYGLETMLGARNTDNTTQATFISGLKFDLDEHKEKLRKALDGQQAIREDEAFVKRMLARGKALFESQIEADQVLTYPEGSSSENHDEGLAKQPMESCGQIDVQKGLNLVFVCFYSPGVDNEAKEFFQAYTKGAFQGAELHVVAAKDFETLA